MSTYILVADLYADEYHVQIPDMSLKTAQNRVSTTVFHQRRPCSRLFLDFLYQYSWNYTIFLLAEITFQLCRRIVPEVVLSSISFSV